MRQLIQAMKTTDQIPGKQTVWQHGQSVLAHYQDLLRILTGVTPQLTWRLPDWLLQCRQQLQAQVLPYAIIRRYTLYHDIGKPWVKTVDAYG